MNKDDRLREEYTIDEKINLNKNSKKIRYIIKDTGCWICISHSKDTNGYPIIRRNDV